MGDWSGRGLRGRGCRLAQVSSALVAERSADRRSAAFVAEFGRRRIRNHGHRRNRRRDGNWSRRRGRRLRRWTCRQPSVRSTLHAEYSADWCSAFVAKIGHIGSPSLTSRWARGAPGQPAGGRGHNLVQIRKRPHPPITAVPNRFDEECFIKIITRRCAGSRDRLRSFTTARPCTEPPCPPACVRQSGSGTSRCQGCRGPCQPFPSAPA